MRTSSVVATVVALFAAVAAGCSPDDSGTQSQVGSGSTFDGEAGGVDVGNERRAEQFCGRLERFPDMSDPLLERVDVQLRAGQDPDDEFRELADLFVMTFADPPDELRDEARTLVSFAQQHLGAFLVAEYAHSQQLPVVELGIAEEEVVAFAEAMNRSAEVCGTSLSQ